MKIKKIILMAVILRFCSVMSLAQQVPMYSQYVMNGFLVNPSLAGRDGFTTISLTARKQWAGLPDAPQTNALSFQTRILKDSERSRSKSIRTKILKPTKVGNVGLGGYVFNDNNGIIHRTGILAAYAYHLQVGQRGEVPSFISLGIAATLYQYAVDINGDLMNSLRDQSDQLLLNYDRKILIPDFNFGATFTDDKYYIGFAMSSLSRGSLLFSSSGVNKRYELGHYFLSGGMKIGFKGEPNWHLQPSVLVKSSDMLLKSIQMDITARVFYKYDYWAGLSYRTNDAVSTMFGFRYNEFYFAYAFDMSLSEIGKRSFGSHELTFALRLRESSSRYSWISSF